MSAQLRSDPHLGQPVLEAGEPLKTARQAMILVHGRGASAENILELAEELGAPNTVYLAPQAGGKPGILYPFLVPTRANEPWLARRLDAVERCVRRSKRRLGLEKLYGPISQVDS